MQSWGFSGTSPRGVDIEVATFRLRPVRATKVVAVCGVPTPSDLVAVYSNSPQHLGAILGELIDRFGYHDKFEEVRAVDAWPELAGPAIEQQTESVWIRNGQLFVKIRSAAWRHQLHLQRESWCKRINQHLGGEVVDEVVFR